MNRKTTFACALLAVLATHSATPAHAFWVVFDLKAEIQEKIRKDLDFPLPLPGPGIEVHPPGHEPITFKALDGVTSVILRPKGVPAEALSRLFSKDAAKAIVDANLSTDDPPYLPYRHFDNATFEQGGRAVIRLRGLVVKSLLAGDRPGAWERLGRALHAIQDFYAHSSWVEKRAFNLDTHTRLSTHYDPGLSTDQERLDKFMSELIGSNREAGCVDDKIGRSISPDSPNVTSGYYFDREIDYDADLPLVNSNTGVRKCVHFGATVKVSNVPSEVDDSPWIEGFEKDDPGSSKHRQASDLATGASAKFVQEIVLELEAMQTPEGLAAVCHLFGQPLNLCGLPGTGDGVYELQQLCVYSIPSYFRHEVGSAATGPRLYAESHQGQHACLDMDFAIDLTHRQTFCKLGGTWIPKTSVLAWDSDTTRTLSVREDGTFSGHYVTSDVTVSANGVNSSAHHFEVRAEANGTTHKAHGSLYKHDITISATNGTSSHFWLGEGPSTQSNPAAGFGIDLLKTGSLSLDEPPPDYCSK